MLIYDDFMDPKAERGRRKTILPNDNSVDGFCGAGRKSEERERAVIAEQDSVGPSMSLMVFSVVFLRFYGF
jgi:hypothetical protein